MGSQSANLWVLLGLGLAGILIMTRKLKKAIREDFGAFIEKFQLLPPPPPPPPKAPHPLTGLTFAVSDVCSLRGSGGVGMIDSSGTVNDCELDLLAAFHHLLDFHIPLKEDGDWVRWRLKNNVEYDIHSFYNALRGPILSISFVKAFGVFAGNWQCFPLSCPVWKLNGRHLLVLIVCCFLFTLVGTKFGVINKERWQLLYGQECKLLNEVHLAPFSCRNEFKHNHGEWISSVKPVLDPAISAEIYETVETADTDIERYKSIRDEMRSAIYSLLKDDGILVIPTIADPPPKLGGKEILSEDYKRRACSLLSIASISGCCQVTIPLGFHNKCPVSVSFIARNGGDRFLLDTTQAMYATLQEQADIAAKSKVSRNVVSKEESAEIAKEKGNQAFKDKQWQKAIGFYTEAIKLSGKNATYYSNRALAYLELGSYLQAEADCTQAINLDKKVIFFFPKTLVDFGYALVLEPTNKRAGQSVDRLKKLFQ
ncbi:outer envelope protein 64, chloroplastic [Quercus suber]|uniref:outer envelope protein 64, chloroplastic n=1 Tax=Quercus suber TaxID=58331 RepID=UPI0032DE4584